MKSTFWDIVAGYFVVNGGASGILIAAIVLNQIQPGHPVYVGIRGWLRAFLGM